MFVGGLFGLIFAVIIAIPINTLPPMSLGLAMFAVLLATNALARNLTLHFTDGQTSLFGIPSAVTVYSSMLFAAGAVVVAYLIQRSSVGLRLRAAREDEAAARAAGVGVRWNRIVAFVISGFIVGVGGGLFVQHLGTLGYDTFYLSTTLITLAMLVVGGIESLTGAVTGTVVLSFLLMLLRRAEEGFTIGPIELPSTTGLTAGGLAIAMIVILILRPKGITGSREFPDRIRFGRRRRSEDDEESSAEDELVKKEAVA
jgi:branched-chain amino acid transport system permease protein